MNWSDLKDVDLMALPWVRVLLWPRRWQCLLLLALWCLSLLVFALVWYWPRQTLDAAQVQQRLQQRTQAENVQADLRARQDLLAQLNALQAPPQRLAKEGIGQDALLLLDDLSAEGVVVDQWRDQGASTQRVAFHGDWTSVYRALVRLSRHMLWSKLTLERVDNEVLQANVDLQTHAGTLLTDVSPDALTTLAISRSPFFVVAPMAPIQPLDNGTAQVASDNGAPTSAALSLKNIAQHYQAKRDQALLLPLASMQLLGVVQAGQRAVALVVANGHIWRVKPGQRLGAQGLHVQRITPHAVQLGQGQALVAGGQN